MSGAELEQQELDREYREGLIYNGYTLHFSVVVVVVASIAVCLELFRNRWGERYGHILSKMWSHSHPS